MRCLAVYGPLFLTFTFSYLGPFVFTRTLLPLLESTATNGDDVRIVNVSLLFYISPVIEHSNIGWILRSCGRYLPGLWLKGSLES